MRLVQGHLGRNVLGVCHSLCNIYTTGCAKSALRCEVHARRIHYRPHISAVAEHRRETGQVVIFGVTTVLATTSGHMKRQ